MSLPYASPLSPLTLLVALLVVGWFLERNAFVEAIGLNEVVFLIEFDLSRPNSFFAPSKLCVRLHSVSASELQLGRF